MLPTEQQPLPNDGRKISINHFHINFLFAGVVKEYRQNGIASFMLENLIAHLTSSDNQASATQAV